MADKKTTKTQSDNSSTTEIPKYKQLIRMLSFRIVPTYFEKIKEVADDQNLSTSVLIRKYIKEGMIRDLEMKGSDTDFRIE
jgi:hypothetical protein